MHDVEEATHKLLVLVLFAGVVGMIVAIFMSWLASYLFARVLRSVLHNTQALAMAGTQENPIPNGAEPHFSDSLNSTAKRLEETVAAMVAERNRFEIVLENMNAAVIALDEKQVIQLVNRPAISMMGLEETPMGKHFKDIVDSEELLSLINKVQSGQPSSVELHIKGPPKRQFLVRATPLTSPGSSVMVLHDITELRRLERVRRDFVANVSHELRTPVSIIRANAETLLDGALEEPELARDFLSALLRHAERLSNLVSDLLDISRIEANEYHLEREEIGLSLIIHRAHEAVEAILHNRQQTTSLQLEDDLMVLADVRSLEQVLLNMLDNAIKYTPAGGHITITSHVVDGFARIKVQDTGPGIKAKHRSRIFERFYRVDKGRSRDMGGTGLGLAIVKHLTETMGGQVGVEPAEPHGSIFWFTIPLAPTEDVSDNMAD
jgi:two-component system phosphate regulon sensor histidine kinase PhoR